MNPRRPDNTSEPALTACGALPKTLASLSLRVTSLVILISLNGSGPLNIDTQTVQAGGVFTHCSASGAVVRQGTRQAAGFTSFAGFGTAGAGQTGGVLSLVVTHYCSPGMSMTGIPMTVTSTVDAPAHSEYAQGTTICDCTEPTGGRVAIQGAQ